MIDLIFAVPAIVKIAVVFVSIVLLVKFKVALGPALLIGSFVLGVWFRMSPVAVFVSGVRAALDWTSLSLSAVVVMILMLSHSLKLTGQFERMTGTFRQLTRNERLSLAIFPALVGLLPMPGGAVFSAPMVEASSTHLNIDAEQKSIINYWFRHVWEYSWPLYPGLILIAALAGVTVRDLALAQIPLTIAAVLIGMFVVYRGLQFEERKGDTAGGRGDWWAFLLEVFPIFLAVGAYFMLDGFLRVLAGTDALTGIRLPENVSLMSGIAVAIVVVWIRNRISRNHVRQVLANRSILSMFVMVTGIVVYKGILQDSGAVDEVIAFFTAQKVPVVLMVILLPFLVGMVTGIAVGFVGPSFPVVVPMVLNHAGQEHLMAYIVLAFASGFTGVLLSPIHVCLVLTKNYFRADLARILVRLLLPCLLLFASGVLLFLLYLRY